MPTTEAKRPTPGRYGPLVDAALHYLALLWPRVDWDSPKAQDAVTTVYQSIVQRFGAGAAAQAADRYDELRAEQHPRSSYRAFAADPVSDEQLAKIVASAFLGAPDTDHTHDDTEASVRTTSDLPVAERVQQRLENSVGRLVQQGARDTIAQNAAKDPGKPTWIRVPTGAKTCAFCLMLASRELGPHFTGYNSKESALFKDNGEKYHNKCDCEAWPVFPGQDANDISPHMSDYKDVYDKAVEQAGTTRDAKKVLAEIRQLVKDEQPPAVDPSPSSDEPGLPEPINLDEVLDHSPGKPPGPPKPPIVVGQQPFGDDAEPPEIDRRHVLDGEPNNPKLGGHRAGTGRPGKTEFPAEWSDDRVINAVQSTMDEPDVVIHRGDRTDYLKEVDRVIVRSSTFFQDGIRHFRSAYPHNGDGVMLNPAEGGPPQPQVLDRSVIDKYRE